MSKRKNKHRQVADFLETVADRDRRSLSDVTDRMHYELYGVAYEDNVSKIKDMLSGRYDDNQLADKIISMMLISFNQGVYAKQFMRHYRTGSFYKNKLPKEYPFASDMDKYQRELGLKK